MDDICCIGTRELAQLCCVCKYPLPLFCEAHLYEHEAKGGFHFTLPLQAKTFIPTKERFIQVREWLGVLRHRFEILRERVEEFSKNEEQIDAVFFELQQHLSDTRDRLKEQFSVAKTQFQTAVETAIQQITIHALDTQAYKPVTFVSHLLWHYDASCLDTYQFCTFQAKSVAEHLDSAFQVTIKFALPGFEHLAVDSPHEQEVDALRRDLRDTNISLAEYLNAKRRLEDVIQMLKLELEEAREQIQTKDREAAALKQANSDLAALVKDEQHASHRHSALEEARFGSQAQERDMRMFLQARRQLVIPQREERNHPNFVETLDSDPADHMQKPIAVLEGEVQFLDVATSQWHQFCKLRQAGLFMRVFQGIRRIQIDDSSSSTFTAPDSVFVCGGGFSLDDTCTCHIGDTAYMLKRDGLAQELPNMLVPRNCPGVAWDPARQSIYVFAGFDDVRGTSYAQLRSSEKFQDSKWSHLPDMHRARSRFNPCWYSGLVYLCGGGTDTMEAYDPQSDTFALQAFSLPEDSAATAVVEHEVLTVISFRSISKLQESRFTHQQHEHYGSWSNCTPVVSKGVVYLVKLYEKCCRGVNLATGAVVKEVVITDRGE